MIRRRSSGITRLEVAVVVVAIGILAAVLVPTIRCAYGPCGPRLTAINTLQQFAKGTSSYASNNHDYMPMPAKDQGTVTPGFGATGEDQVWYNALAPHMDMMAIAEMTNKSRQAAYYTTSSPFFLEKAKYDKRDKGRPQFAFGMNANLGDWTQPTEPRIRQAAITHPSQTVLLAEGGLKGEELPSEYVKKGYPASPLYSGKSAVEAKDFIVRYSKFGVIAFADNHVESKRMDVIVDKNMNPRPGEIG